MCGLLVLALPGGFDRLHYLLETFWDEDDEINPSFVKAFESWMPWDVNPLYALLHESIYCQGAASNWAADRVRGQKSYTQDFDAVATAEAGEAGAWFFSHSAACLRSVRVF
jgi:hypothetical protein